MSKASPWKSRIVGYGEVPASDLLANENNWRIHTKEQRAALGGTLAEVGWVQDVVVNKRADPQWGERQGIETVVDGHMRAEEALKQGDDTLVPVKYVDLTPREEALVLATLDPISAMATTDAEALDTLLRMVDTESEAITKLCAELAVDANLYLDRDGTEHSGASPWERMNGEAGDGMLFTFGEITCRLQDQVYTDFQAAAPKSDIAIWVAHVIISGLNR